MSKSAITLDFIKKSLDKKFAATPVEVTGTPFDMRNPMRLSADERKELKELFGRIKTDEGGEDEQDESEVAKALEDIIILVSDNKHEARQFVAQMGGDLAQLSIVMEAYNEEQKPGEASASQS